MKAYQPRAIRFLEILELKDWRIKTYSISDRAAYVQEGYLAKAKEQLPIWLSQYHKSHLETYGIATLILHECKEGCFAILNWWIDENMLQHFVFLSSDLEEDYQLYSDTGIISCVWELSVIWFERNAWVEHVLNGQSPNFEAYLNTQLNQD